MPLGGLITAGIVAATAAIAGSVTGHVLSKSSRNKAQTLIDESYDLLIKNGYPPDLSQKLIYSKFKEAGILSPELEQHISLGPSAVVGISEDPSLRLAQSSALQKLQDVSRGGLRPEDRAAYNQLRAENERALQGKVGQIQQGFQSRGQGGQGAELAAQLMASQEGANRASSQGDQIAADASRRALEALSSSGELAGRVRSQDFNVNQARANSADEFQKFNAANSMAIQARNIQAKNAAQMANLQNAQNISNQNTSMGNQELARQNEARRQHYLDQMNRTQMIANAKTNQANVYNNQAANTAQNWQSIGAGVGGAINGYANNQRQQSNWNDLMARFPKTASPSTSNAAIPDYTDDQWKKFDTNRYNS